MLIVGSGLEACRSFVTHSDNARTGLDVDIA